MGVDYLFYVKYIATWAPTFFGYIISVLASVIWADKKWAGFWQIRDCKKTKRAQQDESNFFFYVKVIHPNYYKHLKKVAPRQTF